GNATLNTRFEGGYSLFVGAAYSAMIYDVESARVAGDHYFESLPKGALPNRVNIVLTKDEEKIFDDAISCSSIDEVMNLRVIKNCEKCFVIGGAEIYKHFFDLADKLYVTSIRHTFEDADAFFPEIDIDNWRINSVSDEFKADEKNEFPYFFAVYERIR
ncbi:MAG: dihydrofolate reductase, partial [Bacteroidales bacterium]|nr:dihydrofolate reductase [Bacteroidales bacterium]